MNKVLALFFALALSSCATTQSPSVVPALDGTPRVPINKTQPQTLPLTDSPASAAPNNQGE